MWINFFAWRANNTVYDFDISSRPAPCPIQIWPSRHYLWSKPLWSNNRCWRHAVKKWLIPQRRASACVFNTDVLKIWEASNVVWASFPPIGWYFSAATSTCLSVFCRRNSFSNGNKGEPRTARLEGRQNWDVTCGLFIDFGVSGY